MKSVFRPATLNGIETSKNVSDYKATAETMLGSLVILNDTDRSFSVVTGDEAKEAKYALWQYLDAEAHSILGAGTNYYTVKEGQFGRLLYLPTFVGLKDGIEMGGDIIAPDTYAIGDVLVANEDGIYEKTADASAYAVSFVIHNIIEEYDFTRYICEVIA